MDDKPPSEKPKPQTRYADPEDVKRELARVMRLMTRPSPEELLNMPSPSKLIH